MAPEGAVSSASRSGLTHEHVAKSLIAGTTTTGQLHFPLSQLLRGLRCWGVGWRQNKSPAQGSSDRRGAQDQRKFCVAFVSCISV